MGKTWPLGTNTNAVIRSSRQSRTSLSSIPAPHSHHAPRVKAINKVAFGDETFHVTEVFRTFFWFVCERQRVFQRRLLGQPPPWTEDVYLASHPFINVFRVFDRNTQFILKRVIGERQYSLKDAFFRVLLFRTFNKIETWELLETKRGSLTWDNFDIEAYEDILDAAPGALYNGCYIMPSPLVFGFRTNHENHLRLIDLMMSLKVYDRLNSMKHLKDAHGYLCLFPSMGEFTAMQLVLDLNMLPHYDWDEDEWVALGPGSTSCLRKMFGSSVSGREEAAIRHIRDNQLEYFAHFGHTEDEIPRLCEERRLGLTMVDIEHALCECDKYSRAALPHIRGKRHSPGRKYVPKDLPVTDYLPSKWRTPRPPVQWEQPPALDENDSYEVSHVVKEVKNKGASPVYHIRWTGWGPEHDQRITEADLGEGAAELVSAWRALKKDIEEAIEHRISRRAFATRA